MKNAGFILKAGFVAMAALVFTSAAYSQDLKNQNGKQTETPVQKTGQTTFITPGSNHPVQVVNPTLNPSLAVQKRGAIVSTSQGTGARNCTTAKRSNPYSISRANFEKLPADRKQFILDNQNKYTIID
jgi:hypothetical protein